MEEDTNGSSDGDAFLVILIRWAFRLSVVGIAAYFIFGDFFERRQEKFVAMSINEARARCDDNETCLVNVETNGRDCVLNNYHMERASRRTKKYVLDEDEFYACLESSK